MLGAGDLGVLHERNVPQTVRLKQPHSVQFSRYRIRMTTADPRSYLWDNICALMGVDDPSLDTVARRTKVGRGTVQRIKAGDTATRLSSLEKIARAFGIEVWQLLVRELDPKALPRLAGAPAPAESLEARISAIERAIAEQPAPRRSSSGKPQAAGAA